VVYLPWVLGSVGWGFEGKVKGFKRGLGRHETWKQKGEVGGRGQHSKGGTSRVNEEGMRV
jgi:hypothetical protein